MTLPSNFVYTSPSISPCNHEQHIKTEYGWACAKCGETFNAINFLVDTSSLPKEATARKIQLDGNGMRINRLLRRYREYAFPYCREAMGIVHGVRRICAQLEIPDISEDALQLYLKVRKHIVGKNVYIRFFPSVLVRYCSLLRGVWVSDKAVGRLDRYGKKYYYKVLTLIRRFGGVQLDRGKVVASAFLWVSNRMGCGWNIEKGAWAIYRNYQDQLPRHPLLIAGVCMYLAARISPKGSWRRLSVAEVERRINTMMGEQLRAFLHRSKMWELHRSYDLLHLRSVLLKLVD